MQNPHNKFIAQNVAPYAGAWIEIWWGVRIAFRSIVAPYAGAGIEIERMDWFRVLCDSRSLRGSVD